MSELLIDTDILSLFLRNDPNVTIEAGSYLGSRKGFTFSIVTTFEILRGLEVKNASRQVAKFDQIRRLSTELDLTGAIITKAAGIYADLYRGGQLIGDADILIAATALEHNLPLVSNNQNHFSRISGLQLLNWAV